MTYLVQFADKTSKRISDAEGLQVVQALAQNKGVVVKGSFFAYHMISKCSPMRQWVEDEKDAAMREGKKLCKYGFKHQHGERCSCKDAGFLLLPAEDAGHVFPSLMRPPEVQQLEAPDAPPTEKEKAQMEAIQKAKQNFIQKTAMPEVVLPDEGCTECRGTGEMVLKGIKVTCVCVSNKMFTKPQ